MANHSAGIISKFPVKVFPEAEQKSNVLFPAGSNTEQVADANTPVPSVFFAKLALHTAVLFPIAT